MSERLQQLLQFYSEDPNDPFNIYALALEFLKTDIKESELFFEKLLNDHEDYVPTYYHAAKFFEQINDRNKAIAVYEKGIAVAKKMNEQKALRELTSAYEELIFE
jgi:tetratricopeptide (TPR) repeat protein